ncbi:hypothetical protein PROFUN_07589 [Planoprotostelium fungivorum]|uniref:Uncharacterized protein n=1 Tax=Planoprotostelium fungivorum TaxID=1890364 RepID=A0A2P6NLT8_9EUKA|nr:hypothetical protein PROFUN_07589 [Planoprotostelium fungivorum]
MRFTTTHENHIRRSFSAERRCRLKTMAILLKLSFTQTSCDLPLSDPDMELARGHSSNNVFRSPELEAIEENNYW